MPVYVQNILNLILGIMAYLCSCPKIHAQNIYYRDNQGNTYTLREHQDNLKKLYALRKKNGQDVAVLQTFHKTERHGDSLIKYYSVREDKSLWHDAPDYEERSHLEKYVGRSLPTTNLISLDNAIVNLGKPQERPTVLNLWFTQCAPCIEEIPLLNELQAKYKNEVRFVSITFSTENAVQKFFTKTPFHFEHIADAKSYLKQLGVQGYPQTILIDTQGIVRYVLSTLETTESDAKKRITVKEDGTEVETLLNELLD